MASKQPEKWWVCHGTAWTEVAPPTDKERHTFVGRLAEFIARREGVAPEAVAQSPTKPRARPRRDHVTSIEVTAHRIVVQTECGRWAQFLVVGNDLDVQSVSEIDRWPAGVRNEALSRARALLPEVERRAARERYEHAFALANGCSPQKWRRDHGADAWPEGWAPPS